MKFNTWLAIIALLGTVYFIFHEWRIRHDYYNIASKGPGYCIVSRFKNNDDFETLVSKDPVTGVWEFNVTAEEMAQYLLRLEKERHMNWRSLMIEAQQEKEERKIK